MCVNLTVILQSNVLMFHSWLQSVSTIILRLGIFWINLCHEHFVYWACYTRVKAKVIWRPVMCLVWSRSTASWDCSSIFSELFSKNETTFFFFFLLLVPVQEFFFQDGSYPSSDYVKYYLFKILKLSAISKPLFSLICIRFSSCEVRRLDLALLTRLGEYSPLFTSPSANNC